jgi:hypothetical protein
LRGVERGIALRAAQQRGEAGAERVARAELGDGGGICLEAAVGGHHQVAQPDAVAVDGGLGALLRLAPLQQVADRRQRHRAGHERYVLRSMRL